jgi:hypothetical protein
LMCEFRSAWILSIQHFQKFVKLFVRNPNPVFRGRKIDAFYFTDVLFQPVKNDFVSLIKDFGHFRLELGIQAKQIKVDQIIVHGILPYSVGRTIPLRCLVYSKEIGKGG